MSGEICFDCSIKTEKHVDKPVYTQSCATCEHAVTVKFCNECNKKLMFCRMMRYYHDADKLKKCMFYGEK